MANFFTLYISSFFSCFFSRLLFFQKTVVEIASSVDLKVLLPPFQRVTNWVVSLLKIFTIFLRLEDVFFFSFQNNPKDLDPSYKMDLDLWDRLGRVKLV